MKYRIPLVVVGFLILFLQGAQAKTYFIANNGSDSNYGTILSPYLSIAKAVGLATGGDTVYMRGGIYNILTPVTLSKSGLSTAKMQLWSYPGERAILDFTGTPSGKVGITLTGSYWHIKGLIIRLARDNGMRITGATAAYNTIEFCEFYENMDSGLQLDAGANNNRVVNCDSYYNADPTDYGDADGFAVKMAVGNYNYFYGCRAWNNVDDGWDGYLRGTNDVYTNIENCWTWKNGYFKNGTDAGANANGNGFKTGGSDDKTLMHNMVVKNCLAFENKSKGFDQNNNKGNITFYNCTGYNNVGNNYSVPSALNAGKYCVVTNCAELGAKINLGSFVTQTTNSWQSPFTSTVADFISTLSAETIAPRQADGSLPIISYMHLTSGSDFIDAGSDIGLPFNGSKPDLGAWETGNYNVITSSAGKGQVFLNPAGGIYQPGTMVTLTAVPLTGNHFVNWSGGAAGSQAITQITVNSDQLITANFSETTDVGLLSAQKMGEIKCVPSITSQYTTLLLSLPITGKATLSIYDLHGKLVSEPTLVTLTQGALSQIALDLSKYKQGVYIFTVTSPSNKWVCRVVKK